MALIAAPGAQSPPQNPPVIIPPVPPSPGRSGTTVQIPTQRPIFRSGIDLIQVDTTVLDKDRRPVHGLTARDFTVLENGVAQPIVAITEMTASDPEWGPDTWMRTVVPDVRVNNAEDGRVLLLVPDDAHTPPDLFGVPGRKPTGPNPKAAVQEVARAIIERLGPADIAAVIFTVKNKNEQEFTSNPAPPQGHHSDRAGHAHVPGGRCARRYRGRQGRAAAAFGTPTSGPPPTPRYADQVPWLRLDQLTGGFSIRRAQDFADRVAQIFRETGSYYLIGYANPNPKDDGRLRTVDVRVSRPGLTVRSRNGYFAPKASEIARPVSPNWKAISGLLPAKDIPMRINMSTFAIPGKNEVALAIALGLREPLPLNATEPVPDLVTFLTQPFSNEGDRRGSAQTSAIAVNLIPNPRGESKYEILSLLKLKSGKYHIRLSATSRLQGKSGSIYYDVEVPDYGKAPPSLSGVAISTTPPLASGGKEVLAPILPVVPTTQREFQGHRGSAFLRVYQGGKTPIAPVRMAVRILDTNETVVFSKADALAADRFDTHRAAEYRFELPVSTLPPGTYLLTFEATMPGVVAPARQDVRFVVRDPTAGIGR